MEHILAFDTAVLMFIRQNLTCKALDAVMPIITYLAEYGAVPIAFCIALLCFKSTRKTGLKMAISIVMGFIIVNAVTKPLVARTRPYDAIQGIQLLIEAQSDYSFPSGHTLIAFECAGIVAFNHKRYAVTAFVLASLIGFSRLYLFVHYPTDVLASVILGVLFAYTSTRIVESNWKTKLN